MDGNTAKQLSEITDDGAFERLATAILREADPRYAALAHLGVNADGKTIKAPVDAIAFVQGATPRHLVAAQHTTTVATGLASKWLHDPSKVKTKKAKPTAPAGDLIKTAEIIRKERERDPTVIATLALTTNQEPSQEVIRDVHAAANQLGMEADIWSRSRLAHFLDSPRGQWIRQAYLDIPQTRPSKELLAKLSRDSLTIFQPPGDRPEAWIDRSIDQTLAAAHREVVLLIAEAGLGKSVAGYKLLSRHVDRGGFGLVLSHELVDGSLSVVQAIDQALRQLDPHLAPDAGAEALALCEPALPFLILVEDINRSGKSSELLERIASWRRNDKKGVLPARWRAICPAWPQALLPLKDQQRKELDELIILCPPMTPDESRAAVYQRALLQGHTMSTMDADVIATALGHDPLLIALHEFGQTPDAHRVIAHFIAAAIERTLGRAEFTVADYQSALRSLAQEMLSHRTLNPSWSDILSWFGTSNAITSILRHLTTQGEILRLPVGTGNDRIAFRHDRVRDVLLASAFAIRISDGKPDDELLHDPFFAEILGSIAADNGSSDALITMLEHANPLALFYALANAPQQERPAHTKIVAAISRFLTSGEGKGQSKQRLRWYAEHILSQFDSPSINGIVALFPMQGWYSWGARFRNGDVNAGLELCARLDLGSTDPWRDRLMEHVKLRFGKKLTTAIADLLRRKTLPEGARLAAIRISASIADPILAEALETSWVNDADRLNHLDDYLIAAAYCCEADPARLLGPMCDAWASLPSDPKEKNGPSERDDLAAHGVRFAFRRQPPLSAIEYLIERAANDDLRWPITYLLHEVDNPDAIEFTARQLAAIQTRVEKSESFSPFVSSAPDRWSRYANRDADPMSPESKDRLLSLWNNSSSEEHLRHQAFRLWAAARADGDLEVLRSIGPTEPLFDRALFARLERGDHTAIPALEDKLRGKNDAYWWQAGRYLWSDRLTVALDESLTRRADHVERDWGQKPVDADWITSEMMNRLPTQIAEGLLLKHWDHLRFSRNFLHAALYTATPALVSRVADAMAGCPDQKKAMEHIDYHYGIGRQGREGVTRIAQVESLVPYLHLLSELAVMHFWDVCNTQGWLDFRRTHLDPLFKNSRYSKLFGEERAFKALDDMIEKDRVYTLDVWIDRNLKGGTTLDVLMQLLGKWLQANQNMASLVLVANGIAQFGHRRHLSLLDATGIEPKDQAAAVIQDAEFAVKRRTLQ